MSTKLLTLALALCPGIGGRTLARIHTRNELLDRSPDEFRRVTREQLIEEYGLPAKVAESWLRQADKLWKDAEALSNRLAAHGISYATSIDAHYPEQIHDFHADSPGLVYFYGNVQLLSLETFAVLSSRKSPPGALQQIEKCVEDGVLDGEILVTGHNTPEYQRAAVVPLRFGSPRIMVLDQGFFRALGKELKDEPFSSARLWRYQFDEKTDLAISAMHPDMAYRPSENQARDQLIASLAKRLDFVWVNRGGNMETLLDCALECERPTRISDLNHHYREWQRKGAGLLPV